VQLWPWPPTQGQTFVVWLRATTPTTISLAFADRAFPVVSDGPHGWAVIPIPTLSAAATRPLTVTAGTAIFALPVPVRAGVFETEAIPPSASDPILAESDKVQREYERMTALLAADTPSAWTPRARFRLPISPDAPRTAPFGARRTYGSSTDVTAHTGEDFGAAAGTPVLAPASGVVVLAEQLFVRGNAVMLDHGRGVFTGYWHLQAIHVTAGERVKGGQLLGEVGSTGLSTGPHLHWEVRVGGVAVDPMQWVEFNQ
jgi:murein DD-endopeptidase MepM/ murein hydrolase activator NlpD